MRRPLTLRARLAALGLVRGRGPVKDLVRACHAGRLVGGLSVSLRATPDEVIGSVLRAMGAKGFRLEDVRMGPPMQLEVSFDEHTEKWDVEDVPNLVHNLNDVYRGSVDVAVGVVLGEWEDMWQLWFVPKAAARTLLEVRVLDGARNAEAIRQVVQIRDGA